RRAAQGGGEGEPLYLPLVLLLGGRGPAGPQVWDERNPNKVVERTFPASSPRSGPFRARSRRGPDGPPAPAPHRVGGPPGSAVVHAQGCGRLPQPLRVRPCGEQATGERNKRSTCTFTEDLGELRGSRPLRTEARREDRGAGGGLGQAQAREGVPDGRADHQSHAPPAILGSSPHVLGVSRDMQGHRRVVEVTRVLDAGAV